MNESETPRLLSVEDKTEIQILLDHMLDPYRVDFASGVDEALNRIEVKPFDALLLNIQLGSEKKGTDLLHTIRAKQDMDDVPAIAVTGKAMPGDREDLLEKGFDAYVSKPFTRAQLTSAIEKVL